MEHEDELRIREKIKTLDDVPLSWDREIVWSSIRFGVRPSRRIFVYYAAASVALAAALIFFSIERTHQKELELQIAQLDLSIRASSAPVNGTFDSDKEVVKADTSAIRCPETQQVAKIKPPVTRHENVTTKVDAVSQSNENWVAQNIEEKTAVEVTDPVPMDSAQVLEKSAIQAKSEKTPVILGRTLAQSSNPMTSKGGRLHVRIFSGEDDSPASPKATPITTLASINNQ